MFAKRKDLDGFAEHAHLRMKKLEDRYWELWHAHNRLLNHLGLHEHEEPARKVLRSKQGPESTP